MALNERLLKDPACIGYDNISNLKIQAFQEYEPIWNYPVVISKCHSYAQLWTKVFLEQDKAQDTDIPGFSPCFSSQLMKYCLLESK